MKLYRLGLAIFSIITLTSCDLFGSDADEYKTPELFLKKINSYTDNMSYTSSKEEYNVTLKDDDKFLYDLLTQINNYEEISNIKEPSEIYVTYEAWVPAMSGPNIARMTIYENGYLEIYRKQSLGADHFFYFDIDDELAYSINRQVEERILDSIAAQKEAYKEAEEIISIENFFIDAKKQNKIPSSIYDNGVYFRDIGIDVVNKMNEIEYTLLDSKEELGNIVFIYNYRVSDIYDFKWTYNLYKSFDVISISYHFSDSFNRTYTISKRYSISKNKGEELFSYILTNYKSKK